MLMPRNAKHMLDSQWMHRATLPMGVKDGGKEKKRREERRFLGAVAA